MASARFPVSGGSRAVLPIHGLASVFMPWRRLDEIYSKLQEGSEGGAFGRMLRAVGVAYDIQNGDLARMPAAGPLVVVSNHPFGILDGVIIGDLMARVRPDVRILTNYLLAGIPEFSGCCIPIDPFEGSNAISTNRRGVREALRWLQNGGALVIFPAGEVSHLRLPRRTEDPQWMDTAVRLARCTGADVLPAYFQGTNSAIFHALGMIHPRARTIRLPHEFVNAGGKRVQVSLGSLVSHERLQRFDSDSEATRYLRWRTYLLGERRNMTGTAAASPRQEAIAPGASCDRLKAEVARLAPSSCLLSGDDLTVYVAEAAEIPLLLGEIGRLREISFRAVGEGTGRSRDLDCYDPYYKHLFIWNRNQSELVGAYRFADCRQILCQHGMKGLYTSSLFRYEERFFQQLGPAIELGRSFVRPEYQRHYSPLLMLWKGIARYVSQHPESPTLFGAVSISSTYQRASRELLVRFFLENGRLHPLSGLVKPRRPFRPRLLTSPEIKSLSRLLANVEELDAPIGDLEAGDRTVPILLKQYLKVGGNVIGFNVDKEFSDVVDALVFVDLRRTDRSLLKRYMGGEGLMRFLAHHEIGETALPPTA